MKKSACIALLVVTLAGLTGCARLPLGPPRSADGWTAPLDLAGLNGKLDSLPVPRDWKIRQVSSYDRTGGDADDTGFVFEFDDGKVIADLTGPGCIVRLWAEKPCGLVAIYVDDMEHPALTLPFADLFTDYNNLFSSPLVGHDALGGYSYVPIPYRERCLIAIYGLEDNLAYQVTYADLPEDTDIEAFSMPPNYYGTHFFRRWRNEWNRTPDVRLHDLDTEKLHQSSRKIHPRKESLIYTLEGPGILKELEMVFGVRDPEILRKIWVAIYFDGETRPSVVGPVKHLFGAGSPKTADYAGLAFGRHGERMWCRYPMPFKSLAQIRLFNTSDVPFDLKYNITWESKPVDGLLYFHALYKEALTGGGDNYSVAKLSGRGQFAGCSVTVEGAQSLDFLEGDDVMLVDGESPDLHHGTDTDHYFNATRHFSGGTVSTPMHGCTVKSDFAPVSFSAYRCHITDAVPFRDSFELLLDYADPKDSDGALFSSMAYWYDTKLDAFAWPVSGLPAQVVR